LVSQRFWLAST